MDTPLFLFSVVSRAVAGPAELDVSAAFEGAVEDGLGEVGITPDPRIS